MQFTIKTDDKPHLEQLMKTNPQKAKEIIGTFVELMEESCDTSKGIPWFELPMRFSKELTFRELVRGILKGSLDLEDINPDTYDAIKEEVHPLSMLMPRKDYLNGGVRRYEWRNHYRLPKDAPISEETIAAIFRKLLRYYKYVDVDKLAQALINNQVKTFEGLGERNVETLPFMPALRYQQAMFGDLAVGRFLDNVGAFDCGTWMSQDECLACQAPAADMYVTGKYHICQNCNSGYVEESL